MSTPQNYKHRSSQLLFHFAYTLQRSMEACSNNMELKCRINRSTKITFLCTSNIISPINVTKLWSSLTHILMIISSYFTLRNNIKGFYHTRSFSSCSFGWLGNSSPMFLFLYKGQKKKDNTSIYSFSKDDLV